MSNARVPPAIGVVEDHPLYRDALVHALESTGYRIAFVRDTVAGTDSVIRQTSPDIILLDLTLLDGDGLQLARQLEAARTRRPVWLVLSSHDDPRRAMEAREAGCRGFLSKAVGYEVIREAIERLLAGHTVFEPRHDRGADQSKQVRLTSREVECLSLVADGMTNRQIAIALGIGVETVKTLLANSRDKLGASDRAHAVALAFEAGVLGR